MAIKDKEHRLTNRALPMTVVLEKVGVTRNTFLKQWQELGIWPDPVVIDGRRFWLERELDEVLQALPRDTSSAA